MGLQCYHDLSSGLLRVSAVGFMRGNLVGRTAPLASDAGVLALGRSLFALIALVVVDRLIGELITTILAPTGQFGDGLLYGQVAR